MSDFRLIEGFEDVWRSPAGPRRVTPRTILHAGRTGGEDLRGRLTRLANRAPEVMVKVTGRTRDAGHLRAHLDYISRNGELPLELADGARAEGRAEVGEIADAWAFEALADPRRRVDSPMSHSIILSMPAGSDALTVRDAASAFAADVFAGRHDYVFTLHTDTPRPHVHLSVCSRGRAGDRLNPKKADLDHWRQRFAQALRDRGLAAEATPRRTRGVTRRAERGPVRRLRDRHDAGAAAMPRVRQSAFREAAKTAFQGDSAPRAWERASLRRQQQIRSLLLSQADLLLSSPDPEDRRLGGAVKRFVDEMPRPDFQRLALARQLRAANLSRAGPDQGMSADGADRGRTR